MKKSYAASVADNDFTPLELTLENGATYVGMFTDMRLDRETLPEGKFAYDCRHDDETWAELIQLQPFVLVNHAGTFVVNAPIPNAEEGPLITEWSYL